MKSNKMIYITITLLTITIILGTTGLILNLLGYQKIEDTTTDEGQYKVTYKYYVDDIEVSTPVLNEKIKFNSEEYEGVINEINKYTYLKYECTNDVTGVWNENEWTFTPNLTSDTTCKLYFSKNIYELTIGVSNANLPNNTVIQSFLVEKGKTKEIVITPYEGYKYDKIECTNNNTDQTKNIVSEYNEENKTLTLNNINNDNTCTVSFKINDFSVEVNVSNGSVTEKTKSANYGESLEFDVTPSENYVFDKVECTNSQTAKYENNKLKITSISANTSCIVQFKILKFQVNLEVVNGTLLNNYKSPQTASNNGTVSFGISVNDGYQLEGATLDCGNDKNVNSSLSGQVLNINNVTKDLSCKYTLKEKATTTE